MSTGGDPVLPDQGGRLPANPALAVIDSLESLVRRRAYEIYEKRGREPDHALEHWIAAEQELLTMQGKNLPHQEELDVALPDTA